jgi:hypothetical protein
VKVISRADRLDALGATAVIVVHDEPEVIRRLLLAGIDCPFPVCVDTSRTAYALWGLRRASFREIWMDPNVWRQYARLLLAGERWRGSGSDVRQLGGDFVVAADGRIRYARPQERDDRPPVGHLLRALEQAAR